MLILGIETSCDETGIALYDEHRGLLAQHLYSQIKLQANYGGVVPELASRDHIQKTLPLIRALLDEAQLQLCDLNAIAYTAGPGLNGALLVGAAIGCSLGWALGIPAVAVHHMEGHLLAPMLEEDAPAFPFVALLVSGGHTLLVHVAAIGEYEILGESVDDAAGEAFDKTARALGLSYPGGPALAALAVKGNPKRFSFPRPMTDRPGLDFSFSGLKTAVLNTMRKCGAESSAHAELGAGLDEQTRADIACAFQEAVVATLTIKCERALLQTHLTRLVIAGGVSANISLRENLQQMTKKLGGQVYYPRSEFCTDNGAMIAYAGMQRLKLNPEGDGLNFSVRARWPITEAGTRSA